MKTLQITALIFFSLTMSSCLLPSPNNGEGNSNYNEEVYYGNEEGYDNQYDQEGQYSDPYMDNNQGQANNRNQNYYSQNGKKDFPIYDQKTGQLMATIPYPASWRKVNNSREWTYEGPNNVKVSGEFGQHFTYGYGSYGNNSRPPMSLQQIIDEFFMPNAKQTNRTLVTTYELPNVAQKNKEFLSQLWQYAPSQKTVKSYGLEWKDPQGMRYLTILTITDDKSNLGSYWAMMGQFIQAPERHFEQAKTDFIYGKANINFNQQQIASFNQGEVNRANASNAAHQQRMAAINARGQAILNAGKTYSEISDINHAGYLSRSNLNDHGHSKTIQGIHETVTIANHGTGEHYAVPTGNNHYWVANDGTYFGTDNANFNPNINNQMNNKDWTKFEIEQ